MVEHGFGHQRHKRSAVHSHHMSVGSWRWKILFREAMAKSKQAALAGMKDPRLLTLSLIMSQMILQ